MNGATARVVASTNAGRRQLEDANESIADLANTITLTQIKRKEMDSQASFSYWLFLQLAFFFCISHYATTHWCYRATAKSFFFLELFVSTGYRVSLFSIELEQLFGSFILR